MQHDIGADTKALCRVCMTPEIEQSFNLYDPFPFGQRSLHEMLQAICAPVFTKSEAEDVMPTVMPTKVCLACRNATVAAYSLHLQCIETDRRLGELVALMWDLQGPREDEVVQDCGDLIASSSMEETLQVAKRDCSQKEYAADKTCSACGKIFATRYTLARHKREGWCDNTNDPKQRTCDICYKVLRTVQLMKRHREMHDSTDVPCPATELPATTQEHPVEGNMPTEEIPLLNTENVDLIKVEALDLVDENENDKEEVTKALDFQCTNCGISFSSQRAHRRHTQEGNCQRSRTFPCTICGKVFDKHTRLQYHLNSHRKRFECSRCTETFKSKLGLLKHMKRLNQCSSVQTRTFQDVSQEELEPHSKHEQPENQGQMQEEGLCAEERPNESLVVEMQTQPGETAEVADNRVCPDCGVTFLSARAHRNHVQQANCQRSQTFPCTICGKVFDKHTRLQYHLNSHRKRFVCSRCNETFKSKLGLVKHMKRLNRCSSVQTRTFQDVLQEELEPQPGHEQPENQGQMQEERTNESLVVEMQTQPGKTAAVADDRVCTDCGVTFLSARAHRNHAQLGNCQRFQTFPCTICGKVFDKHTRLQYHLNSHRKCFVCSRCNETFKSKLGLLKHMKRLNRCSGVRARTFSAVSQGEHDRHQYRVLCAEERTNESLVIEMQTQPGEIAEVTDDWVCTDCGVTFLSARAHRNHAQQGNCRRKRTFPCKKCGKVFDKQSRMYYHLFSHRERVACSQCDETFRYRGALVKHIKYKRCSGNKVNTFQQVQTQREEDEVEAETPVGDTSTERTEQAEEQGQMHGEQDDAAEETYESFEVTFLVPEGDTSAGRSEAIDIQCTDCGITFSSERAHRDHTQERSCQRTRTFPCKICGKVFDKRTRRDYHMLIHKETVSQGELATYIKRENSEEHPKGQKTEEGTNESLVAEMQALEGDTTEVTISSQRTHKMHTQAGNWHQKPIFPCTICGKIFYKLSRLRYHRRYHHGGVSHEDIGAIIKQEYSEEQNRGTEELGTQEGQKRRRPMQIRDKQCTDCGVTFLSIRAFKKHTAEGDCQLRQNFPCTICGKIFDTLSRMQYHRRNHQERLPCSNCGLTFKNRYCLHRHLKRTVACRKALEDPLLYSEALEMIKVEEPEIGDVAVVKSERLSPSTME